MQKVVVEFILMVIIPSAGAALLQSVLCKETYKKHADFFLYYVSQFYSFFSLIKLLLGEGDCTLGQSFSDNCSVTYFHYFPIILVLVISIPVILYLFEKRRGLGYHIYIAQNLYTTSFGSVIIYTFLYNGYIRNRDILFVVVLFAILILLHVTGARLVQYKQESKAKKYEQLVIPFFLFYTLIFYIPNQLYLTNISDFQFGYGYFLINTILCTFAITIICGFYMKRMPNLYRALFLILLFSISIAGYIQANFLNGDLSLLNGESQSWTLRTKLLNSSIWVGIILVILYFGIRFVEKTVKTVSYISVLLILMQLCSWAYLLIQADFGQYNNVTTNENLFLLGKDENIIVFILDMYDEQVLERIVEEDEGFLEPLDGFTWYNNQASRYSHTSASIPFLLTDIECLPDMTVYEYPKYAFSHSSFIQYMNQLGYNIGIYTDPQYIIDESHVVKNFVSQGRRAVNTIQTLGMATKIAKYQVAPFILKAKYHYETYEISHLGMEDDEYSDLNSVFYNRLLHERIQVADDICKAFRFYHIMGIHDLIFDEKCNPVDEGTVDVYECGIGTMKIVYEYIDQLKKNDLYDKSTIIITADHGQDTPWNNERKMKRDTNSPILFIKRPYSRGDIVVSNSPVSHTEFCTSIIRYAGGVMNGDSYEDIPSDCERIRIMEHISQPQTAGDFYCKWIINGKTSDPNAYHRVE